MSEKSSFERDWKAATEQLLAEIDTMNGLCDPAQVEDPAVIGVHLDTAEVAELHQMILAQVEDVAGAVGRALDSTYPEVGNFNAIAAANTVLDAAIPDPKVPGLLAVEAGLITQLRDQFHDIDCMIVAMLDKMKNAGPDFSYIFDIRLETGKPEKTWLKDFEALMQKLQSLTDKLGKYSQLYISHGAQSIYKLYEAREKQMRNESETYMPEFLSRAMLLYEDFTKLTQPEVPDHLSEELAVHYFEVLHLLKNNLVRAVLHFSNEREEPGFDFNTPQKGAGIIYTSYAERFSKFLDTFRTTLIAVNAIERALLLLECRGERLDRVH